MCQSQVLFELSLNDKRASLRPNPPLIETENKHNAKDYKNVHNKLFGLYNFNFQNETEASHTDCNQLINKQESLLRLRITEKTDICFNGWQWHKHKSEMGGQEGRKEEGQGCRIMSGNG